MKTFITLQKIGFLKNKLFLNTHLELMYLKFKEQSYYNPRCKNDKVQFDIEEIKSDQYKSIYMLIHSYTQIAWYDSWDKRLENMIDAFNGVDVIESISEITNLDASLIAIFDDFIIHLKENNKNICELFSVINALVHFADFKNTNLVEDFQNEINDVLNEKQLMGWSYNFPHWAFNFMKSLLKISDENKESVGRLEKQTLTDNLTSLPNRVMFNRDFSIQVASTWRHRLHENFHPTKWIFALDIDFFKRINDQYGHHIWDIVLVQFANVLNNAIRTEDTLYRTGWEEFMLLCECWSREKALNFWNKILECIESNLNEALRNIPDFPDLWDNIVTMSVWIHNLAYNIEEYDKSTLLPESLGINYEKLEKHILKQVDKALYYSKNNWRNRCTFSDEINESVTVSTRDTVE